MSFTMARSQAREQRTAGAGKDCCKWLEKALDRELDDDLHSELRSGVVLCDLLNQFSPDCIRSVNRGAFPMHQRENIEKFRSALLNFGFNDVLLFSASDLYDGQNMSKVYITLHHLADYMYLRGFSVRWKAKKEKKAARPNSRVLTSGAVAVALKSRDTPPPSPLSRPVSSSSESFNIDSSSSEDEDAHLARRSAQKNDQLRRQRREEEDAQKARHTEDQEERRRQQLQRQQEDDDALASEMEAVRLAKQAAEARMAEVQQSAWFFDDISSEEAEQLLLGRKARSCILRPTGVPFCIALSMVANHGEVIHSVIEVSGGGFYAPGLSISSYFSYLEEVVFSLDGLPLTPAMLEAELQDEKKQEELQEQQRLLLASQQTATEHAAIAAVKARPGQTKTLPRGLNVSEFVDIATLRRFTSADADADADPAHPPASTATAHQEKQRPEPTASNPNGNTELHIAATKGDLATVQRLLATGVDVDSVNAHGWTALYTAVHHGHADLVAYLMKAGANVDAPNEAGWTAVFVAVAQKRVQLLKDLIGLYGADINRKSNKGTTPLYYASYDGLAEITKVLLDARADTELCTGGSWRPIHAAVFNSHLAVVKLLVHAGADLNKRNAQLKYYTPLHIALSTATPNIEIVELLVSSRADLNMANVDLATPLHLAAYWGHTSIIKYLLENGAVVTATNKRCRTARDIAERKGFKELTEFLALKMIEAGHPSASADGSPAPVGAQKKKAVNLFRKKK